MSKQVLVVSSQQRSVRGRVTLVLVAVGLAIWFVQSPAEAGQAVGTGWDVLTRVGGALGTFISAVVG